MRSGKHTVIRVREVQEQWSICQSFQRGVVNLSEIVKCDLGLKDRKFATRDPLTVIPWLLVYLNFLALYL